MGCGVDKNEDHMYYVVCNFNSSPKPNDNFNEFFPIITQKNIDDAIAQDKETTKLKEELKKQAPPVTVTRSGPIYIARKIAQTNKHKNNFLSKCTSWCT